MIYKVENDKKEFIFSQNIEKFKELSDNITDFFSYKFFIEMGYTLIEGYMQKAMKNIVKFSDEVEIRGKLNSKPKKKRSDNLKETILNIFPERYNEISYRNDIVHCNYFKNEINEEQIFTIFRFNPVEFVPLVKKVNKYIYNIEYIYKLSRTSTSLEEYKKACSIYVKNSKLLKGKDLKRYTDLLQIDFRNIAEQLNASYQEELWKPLSDFTSHSIFYTQNFESLKNSVETSSKLVAKLPVNSYDIARIKSSMNTNLLYSIYNLNEITKELSNTRNRFFPKILSSLGIQELSESILNLNKLVLNDKCICNIDKTQIYINNYMKRKRVEDMKQIRDRKENLIRRKKSKN